MQISPSREATTVSLPHGHRGSPAQTPISPGQDVDSRLFEKLSSHDLLSEHVSSNGTTAVLSLTAIANDYKYDFGLSCAESERKPAEKLAKLLRERNIRVFCNFDDHGQTDLWGEDRYQKFQQIYGRDCRFFIPFVSVNYVAMSWPKHELKQAQARAFKSDTAYILPIRFDDTEVPGLNDTTGYISAQHYTIEKIAELCCAKLAINTTVNKQDLEVPRQDHVVVHLLRLFKDGGVKIFQHFNQLPWLLMAFIMLPYLFKNDTKTINKEDGVDIDVTHDIPKRILSSETSLMRMLEIYHRYMIFCISLSSCVAILYWYLRYKTKCITNIPKLPWYYIVSHWSDKLEQKINKLAANIPAGYPIKIAITGTAGSGKTELAKYYAIIHNNEFDIIWSILADTPENILKDYCSLAIELKFCTVEEVIKNLNNTLWLSRVQKQIKQYLTHKRCLFIMENPQGDLKLLDNFFPESKITIIYTTQNAQLLENDDHRINISEGLALNEATDLLWMASGLIKDEHAVKLAEKLDCLPLYLLAASSTINNSPNNWKTYEEYNKHIQELSARNIAEEHARRLAHLGLNSTQYAVMSYAINQLSEDAMSVLRFCSYIYSTGIKLELIKDFFRAHGSICCEREVDLNCDRVLSELQKFSLLNRDSHDAAVLYRVHGITQEICREEKTVSKDDMNIILNSVLCEFNKHVPIVGSFECVDDVTLLPHAIALKNSNQVSKLADKDLFISLLKLTGILYLRSGNAQESAICFQSLLENLKEQTDKNNTNYIDLCECCNILSLAYGDLEHYDEQENLLRNNLSMLVSHTGYMLKLVPTKPKPSDFLYTDIVIDTTNKSLYILDDTNNVKKVSFLDKLIDLDSILKITSDKKQVQTILIQNIENLTEEELQVLNHNKKLIVALTQAYLAAAYLYHPTYNLSKHEEALHLLNQALPVLKVHCPQNRLILHMSDLSNTYRFLGDLQNARKTMQEALDILEKDYGKTHRSLIIPLINMATICKDLGSSEEADQFWKRALDMMTPFYFKTKEVKYLEKLKDTYWVCDDPKNKRELLVTGRRIVRKEFGSLV